EKSTPAILATRYSQVERNTGASPVVVYSKLYLEKKLLRFSSKQQLFSQAFSSKIFPKTDRTSSLFSQHRNFPPFSLKFFIKNSSVGGLGSGINLLCTCSGS